MPGKYDAEKRLITINTELSREPFLTTATLINNVVTDMLYRQGFSYGHFPELVDLAVIGSGLGSLLSNLGLVKNTGVFWDSTKWLIVPRPFLGCQSLAYANAIAAWLRNESDPVWAKDLIPDVRGPMKKSLKYLFKTNDCFLSRSNGLPEMPERSQSEWLNESNADSVSTQIIATRHLNLEGDSIDEQKAMIVEKLQSRDRTILIHAIEATQNFQVSSDANFANEPIVHELRSLTEHRDDEVRAKAMISLTRIVRPDEATVIVAAKMLDSTVKHIVFAGVFALSVLESVPDHVILPANRAFARSLQSCNYEFVQLFTASFNRWLDDPKAHFERLLAEDSPEYLEIALEALDNIRERIVAID